VWLCPCSHPVSLKGSCHGGDKNCAAELKLAVRNANMARIKATGFTHMRNVLAIVVGIVLGVLAAMPAFASMDESRAWFESLSEEDRSSVQYDLVLLGHFKFIIDRQFGENTYQAIVAFQRSQGMDQTGVLDADQRQTLFDLSDVVYKRLGLTDTTDTEGRSSLVLPAGLLTEVTPYNNGNTYATADGGISLETLVTQQSEMSFSALFASYNATQAGLEITDASYNTSRFVVQGTRDGREFYTMYENAGTESVGYSLSWTPEHAADAQIIKIFIASYFIPLKFLSEPETDKAAASTIKAFGVWSLPEESPEVIALNGEIGSTLVADFDKAIEARPDARVLVLNSPGGYVDDALVVAHKVKDRGMSTLVAKGMGCYSACSYIYFAGQNREVEGELGVHQISAEVADLVMAQTTLADVLSALNEFEVTQSIITVMLQTPPEEMYIFNADEIANLGIERGEDIEVALIESPAQQQPANNSPGLLQPGKKAPGWGDPVAPQGGDTTAPASQAYVTLAWRDSQEGAEQSLQYAKDMFAGALGDAVPEISTGEGTTGPIYGVRVPAASMENANAICAAIQSAGGGCYVSEAS
jgi:ATP-dependent protease ClpP protease subunit